MSTYNIQPVLPIRMQLGECPLWHAAEAALYWIDIDGRAVHRHIPATGAHQHWDMPSEPGCIAIRAAGGLLVALRSGLIVLNTRNGEMTPVADAPYDQRTTRFNDGRCDAAGRLWVGSIYEPRDHAHAALYCIERDAISDSGKRATVSNGVAFSPDNKTLYHADTTTHRIFACDYDVRSAALGASRVLHQFSTDKQNNYGGRPDGAAVDSEGNYWCAMYEGGRLLRLSPQGDILSEIALPVRCPTMMAFGGDDLRTLYITSVSKNRPAAELEQHPLSGNLLSVRVDVAGLPEHVYLA
ncbi:gluconolactonase [Herminiimonas sp. KBW02]|uniref:SMP-30/gluconolactonase/LRE family protein n=1 Tax=Herminiimonas sp. KBW02 TaxID=2153363 RepID=UPI000F59B5B2|nr:SMP-30/gluconolactonase/LRE family protein [Herminiimonas sp. KBW02]RQO34298.1 gluconolactonase [Herminiimonas sp. KBW02]